MVRGNLNDGWECLSTSRTCCPRYRFIGTVELRTSRFRKNGGRSSIKIADLSGSIRIESRDPPVREPISNIRFRFLVPCFLHNTEIHEVRADFYAAKCRRDGTPLLYAFLISMIILPFPTELYAFDRFRDISHYFAIKFSKMILPSGGYRFQLNFSQLP